tara:strand:+ start:993 stop:1400 length:408 start_codon:yes stop_codon:yes gene_type:complete
MTIRELNVKQHPRAHRFCTRYDGTLVSDHGVSPLEDTLITKAAQQPVQPLEARTLFINATRTLSMQSLYQPAESLAGLKGKPLHVTAVEAAMGIEEGTARIFPALTPTPRHPFHSIVETLNRELENFAWATKSPL